MVFNEKLENGWWIDYMDGDNKKAPWVQPVTEARTSGMCSGQGLCVNLLAKVRAPCCIWNTVNLTDGSLIPLFGKPALQRLQL
jgi:hypothetical protein